MKIVINECFGGFSLSPEALLWLWERGMKEIGTPVKEYYGGEGKFAEVNPERAKEWENSFTRDLARWKQYDGRNSMFMTVFSPDEQHCLSGAREICRTHPLLIECVDTLGEKANGPCAELKIIEIPDGIDWEVEEYDGLEHVAEKHQVWT